MKSLQHLLFELEVKGLNLDLIQPGLCDIGSDLAMPCFRLAKIRGISPQSVAEEIVAQINHPALDKILAINGYVNLWLNTQFLVQTLNELMLTQTDLGRRKFHGAKVVIDYFSPNLAKPLHAGHLRNLWQGRALTKLYQFLGYEVITDNHLGDWGTVFGEWVVGLLKYGDDRQLQAVGINELGRIYKLIKQDLETEAVAGQTALKDEAQAWLLKLAQADKQALEYHQLFRQISQTEIDQVLEELEIAFDEALGEAFYQFMIAEILGELESKGIASRQTDGSLVADLSIQGIKTPILLQKSNGANLYASSDVATLVYRQDRWQPQQIIYVVGAEQQFYFKQLFALNRLAQLSSADLIHHAYGLIEELNEAGGRQKMSSRRQAISLQDILKQALRRAQEVVRGDLDDKDLKKIAYGALAFQEFCQNKKHNILFNWQKIFSLTEMSGSYVQYATLRLQSILRQTQLTDFKPDLDYNWQAEHTLIMKLLKFEDVLDDSLTQLELSKIGLHIFELSRAVNRYLEQTFVLDQDLKLQASRLWLMQIIVQHLQFALDILGVKIPSKM